MGICGFLGIQSRWRMDYGAVNCTDGTTTSAESDCPYPMCNYAPVGCDAKLIGMLL